MIILRAVNEADMPRLFDIYASTRAEEMALVPHWTEEQKKAFLSQQFLAQHQYYQDFYQVADFHVIEVDQEVVGRLYVHWEYSPLEIRIMDISLLSGFRGKGIGSKLIKEIQQKATVMDKAVTIHVESSNPALQLYQRLGFQKIGEFNSFYYLMEWKPETENK